MLKIKFWDVNHGSAAWVQTPNGKNIVIDLGSGSYGQNNGVFSPLMQLKNVHKVDELDMVIITHPHADHISDIKNFEALNPRFIERPKHLKEIEIRDANQVKDKEVIDKYIEISNRYQFELPDSYTVFNPQNNGGVKFKIFKTETCSRTNINNHSVVTIIEYAGTKVIIPGDNEKESWDKLMVDREFISSIKGTDIFVASHHGRDSGYYGDLFDYFNPFLCIISDGRAGNTSVTSKYSGISKGWNVISKKTKTKDKRKCLTTRQDGCIELKMYNENGQNYLGVYKDK